LHLRFAPCIKASGRVLRARNNKADDDPSAPPAADARAAL